MYCEAYFVGANVQLVRPGDTLSETTRGGAKRTKKIPSDFVKHHKITVRENSYGPQMNATEINEALREYRMSNTFCTLAVTNTDLYPREEWNFVFGLANLTH